MVISLTSQSGCGLFLYFYARRVGCFLSLTPKEKSEFVYGLCVPTSTCLELYGDFNNSIMQIGASLQNVKFGGRNGKVAAGGYSSRCPRPHSTLRVCLYYDTI